MNILRKIQYNQYWNIGFCEQTPEELIRDKQLKPVRWLKHPYRDRWFADPFIYKVTESEIVVFVEECPMESPKGIICELVIDRKTMRLKERYVMLELDTHLSYPTIIRLEEKVYAYPENGASGKLNIYEYDELNHKLTNPVCILNEAVADASIMGIDGHYLMIATKYPKTQERAFLYEADSIFGPFTLVDNNPIQTAISCSRPGGNWMHVNDKLYRPAQNCVARYGAGISLMSVDLTEKKEEIFIGFESQSWRYNEGLHTINFHNNLCVIDGYGYYWPILGRLYYSPFLRSILGKKKH